ncbi:uncharacterized protein LOC116218610 isoform X1 [Clupea harengus]|uniref:Uncharacterized protein LOC116218610 isoform X1 n=1 Tax=Clupea harengus TaxID=7950 RepID=A0A8M1KAS5_CLUHA|nr:uncharacterized protein LOC116218610 isoform X1 [Clupea harengus]
MSTTSRPTVGTPQLTTDELTVIVASLSCLVFFLVIMVLLCMLYRRDPLCCKVREYQGSHTDLSTPPQYYSSTQTLVGPRCSQESLSHENTYRQSDSLFLIGLPSSYGLPSLAVPRLPSYESVRKKDRQRQIHMMIADRFGLNGPYIPEVIDQSVSQSIRHMMIADRSGLNGPYIPEPPPSYEESIHQAVEIPCAVIGPLHGSSDVIGSSEVCCSVIGPSEAPGDVIGPSEAPGDVIGPSEVSCDVNGLSIPPCDVTGPVEAPRDRIDQLNAPLHVIGPLNAPPDRIGPLNAPLHVIGPLNAPLHVIGPAGASSPATSPP